MHLLSIDLEDWFHLIEVEQTARPEQWQSMPSRVELMTHKLLDFFDTHQVKATFFCLGWVATKYPFLLKDIVNRGHELGCHSNHHRLVHKMTQLEFKKDLLVAIEAIYKASGVHVKSYRAPGFSITKECFWAFEELASAGIVYDSSVFPATHAHGGIPGAPKWPFIISTKSGDIKEFPISTFNFFSKAVAFSGGGYFRLFPLRFHKFKFLDYEAQDKPVITYLHPRDFDHEQPKIKLPVIRTFKNNVNISSTFYKLGELLKLFNFGTLTQVSECVSWDQVEVIELETFKDVA